MWSQQNVFLDKRKSHSFMIVAIFVVSISSVLCQNQANVEPRSVTKQEGESVTILCTFGRAIDRCDFDAPNGDRIKLNPTRPSIDPNYEYFGTGFGNGQCGLKINRLQRVHEGEFTCRLDLGDGSADVLGRATVTIAQPPSQPQVIVHDPTRLEANQPLNAECKFQDGRPSATISWFLGTQELQHTEYDNQNDRDEDDSRIVVSRINELILRPDHNSKLLTCRLDHPAYPDGFVNASTQLTVFYTPMALSRDELNIQGLEIGRNADIEIRIRSNPRPRLTWTVDGFTINEGGQRDRFEAPQAEQLEDGRWLAKLTIAQLRLEDTTKTYLLRAAHEYGSMDYQIRIGGSSEAESSGLGIVPIIAITVIALFVLIIVALLVVARITRRWCFAGDSLHPNSPDSEAQIAPDEDKNHEHYEQHESKVSDEETGDADNKPAANGKSKGNTSV